MPFVPCKGFFHKYTPSNASGAGGEGFFTVDGLSEDDVLIQGVNVEDKDVVMPVVTLENFRILYSFGADFGSIGVIGAILLGEAGGGGPGFNKVRQFFEDKRVSKAGDSTVKVTGPGGSGWEVYMTGLSMGEPDPQFHIQPFVLVGQIAEPA